MKSNTNEPKTIYLKDYRAPDYRIEKINLHFDIREESTIVQSSLKCHKNKIQGEHNQPLVLDGDELKLLSVKLNDKKLDSSAYELKEKSLTLNNLPDSFELLIETEIFPDKNTALSGLYRSDGLFCTQCEAEGFRRITYYLDRPDVMTCFSTTIEANKAKYPVLLSNGNLVDKGDNGDRHWATWEDPFKKPAYLFALVAGALVELNDSFITKSGREVKLALFVEKENINKCQHAIESLKNSMKWDEEKYGREYDLDIYMIVAVNNFNMGAMENKGLNIFNSKYVLAEEKTATDVDFQGVEMVVGHEYFHNWTGNRVTLRDWFQLSLKEGLTVFREQQFSADMGSPVVKRIEDVKQIRTRQYAEDSGPITHPVRPDSYIEINNFYTMTIYYKGAEVIRMLHTLLGEQGFRKGMDLYFERHDGEAVTIEHFVAAMSDANQNDLNQFMRWYDQAGTPVVHVDKHYDPQTKTLRLNFKQSCPATPNQPAKKPFVIPIKIALYEPSGKAISLETHSKINHTESGAVFTLNQEIDELVFENCHENAVPSFLGNFSAPVKLQADYSDEDLAFLIRHDQDGFNRWDVAQTYKCQLIINLMKEKNINIESIPATFLELYQHLLTENHTDPALRAELLGLPSFHYIAEQLPKVDAHRLNRTLSQFRVVLFSNFSKELENLYHEMVSEDDGSLSAKAISSRSLKNLCLNLLARAQLPETLALIEQQFVKAHNMTDKMGALWAINHWGDSTREKLFDEFYQEYKADTLVLDKWLGLQAQAELPDTLKRIQDLLTHEAFDIKIPNKVYALIRSFAANNAQCFHEKAGQGYEFIADRVIELNQKNPQVAARVLEPLTSWKRFDTAHSQLMKKSLQKIQDVGSLSEDVYEIVSKSLA